MLQAGAPGLLLASGSPTRAALMRAAGLRFQAQAGAVDEAAIKRSARADGFSPDRAALVLAEAKAHAVAAANPDALVIGADQILVCGDDWFDKPPDKEAARRQLIRLSGRSHALVTAAVCQRDGAMTWSHVATPILRMRPLSTAFIDAYLDAEGDAVLGCVGAYRIETLGIRLFDRVEGEHGAILGLPMLPLLAHLRACGVLADD